MRIVKTSYQLAAERLASASWALRNWTRSEYDGNKKIEAEYDAAVTQFCEVSGLFLPDVPSVSEPLDAPPSEHQAGR